MIDVFYMSGYRAGVMGLGRSGLSAAKALGESGAEVWAWDDNEDRRADATAEGVTLVDLHICNMQELDTLVWSPGIPHNQPRSGGAFLVSLRHSLGARDRADPC